MSAEATVETWRGGRRETVHRLSVAVADARGSLLARAGDPRERTYWRSAAKPFQLLPFAASGGLDAYGFGSREIAIMCSSHNGEAPHRAAAARILDAAGLAEADLLCGAHLPSHAPAWMELARAGGVPTPLWNNCSGKHAGMLAYCRFRGWPTFDYRLPDHPLQEEIREVVLRASGEPADAVAQGVDGCGVPAFHLSLAGMATAYARLSDGGLPEAWAEPARRLLTALSEEPFFLAGTDRLCTRLVEATGGRVIAKVGAAGVFCAVVRDRACGVALKVEDGAGPASGVALIETLRQVGALEPEELEALAPFAAGELRNHAGTPVGEVVARFRLAPTRA